MEIVCPGEVIKENSSGYLCGHGTFVDSDTNQIISTKCGLVKTVNKLLWVDSLRSAYVPSVGDTVIGTIRRLGTNYWSLDIGSTQQAQLRLSSVNLPHTQRRKTFDDQLNMRQMFKEDDLLVAEVLEAKKDKRCILQTRSARYGKLGKGLCVKVQSSLIKRQKQHFSILPFGIQVILAMNGWIWIQPAANVKKVSHTPFSGGEKTVSEVTITKADRENISRVRNAILALQSEFIMISSETIMDVYQQSENLAPKEMTNISLIPLIVQTARQRMIQEAKKGVGEFS